MATTKRGCGFRVPGGIYLETKLSPYGRPIEDFLIDVPWVMGERLIVAIGLRKLGVSLVPRKGAPGIIDVWDWVGNTHYPNVADVIEETRRQGASRRLSPQVARDPNFKLVGPESRLILIHDRAYMTNGSAHRWAATAQSDEASASHYWCPKHIATHEPMSSEQHDCWHCLGMVYHDIEGGTPAVVPTRGPRSVLRRIGSTDYVATERPEGFTPEYQPAAFLALPISGLAVIADHSGKHAHLAAIDALKGTGLPWALEDN